MRKSYNSTFSNSLMLIDCIFYRCSAQVVTRNNNHIINSSGNPVIANLISQSSITGKIFPRELRKICINISLMIPPNGSCNSRPWIINAEVTKFLVSLYLISQFIHQYRSDRSEEHTSELQSRPHLVCR